ncbi:MAG: sigma-70 family RNA polymerase sigma factor [Mogibacterium sp.]|nr:sigma-70 family RNA polymerase sigma factor [Mogibacterium sp.]
MNEKLFNEAAAGSKEAFAKLYGEYKDRLYRYALYRLRDTHEAEDAVSECVLAAWKGIGGLHDPGAFGSWIFKILSACCASRIKEMIKARESTERAGQESLFVQPDSASLPAELIEALDQLNEEERSIVLLSVIGGFTSSEISSVTGLTAGSVRSKLSRSLAKMREFLF